jgi:hypothetical protein
VKLRVRGRLLRASGAGSTAGSGVGGLIGCRYPEASFGGRIGRGKGLRKCGEAKNLMDWDERRRGRRKRKRKRRRSRRRRRRRRKK